MSEGAMVRVRDERARVAVELETIERERDARRHFLRGFDLAVEILTGDDGAAAALPVAKPLALPAPKRGRKQRRTVAPRKRADVAGGGQGDARETRLAALWPTDATTVAIAKELRCTTVRCYQIAAKLKLGRRPASSRAKRTPRAKKAAAAKPAAEPAPAPARRIEIAPRPAKRIEIVERSATARPAPRPSVIQRTQSALAPPPRPKLPPVPASDDAAVARFIAEKGVTRAADFGPHQAVVEAARSVTWDVLRLKLGYGQLAQWSLNGANIRTDELYRRVNAELARRGRPPIAQPAETAAG